MYDIKKADPSVRARVAIEQEVVTATVQAAINAGYYVSVFDGEQQYKRTNNLAEALKDLMETDEDYLFIWDSPHAPRRFGWVRFVYGNDGYDVVNDYSVNLDSTGILAESDRIFEKYTG